MSNTVISTFLLSPDAHFAAHDASPLPTTFVTADMRFAFVNRAYERWFGWKRQEVVGASIEEVLGKTAAEALAPYAMTALKGATVEFEITLLYRTRGQRRMHIVYAGMREPDGRVPGYFGFLEDVTPQYEGEAAINAALDGMGDGYYALDRHLRFTFVNQSAADFLGRSREDLIGRHLNEAFPGALERPGGRLILKVMETSSPQRRELASASRPGRRVQLDVVPLTSGGVGVVLQEIDGQAASSFSTADDKASGFLAGG